MELIQFCHPQWPVEFLFTFKIENESYNIFIWWVKVLVDAWKILLNLNSMFKYEIWLNV